jgi:hypothetical protein
MRTRKLPLAAVSAVLGLALAIGSFAPSVVAPEAEAAGRGSKKATAKKSGGAKAPAKAAKATAASTKSCGTFFYRKDGQCVDARAKAK